MTLNDWQMDLRVIGFDGPFDYQSLKDAIQAIGRLESLVQMPEKKDPDWQAWAARGTAGGNSFSAYGDTDMEALGKLLAQMWMSDKQAA